MVYDGGRKICVSNVQTVVYNKYLQFHPQTIDLVHLAVGTVKVLPNHLSDDMRMREEEKEKEEKIDFVMSLSCTCGN